MENNQSVPSQFESLWVPRLILFVELGPQQNKYRQIILNPHQFRIVADALGVAFGSIAGLPKAIAFNVADEIIDLPTELQQIYYKPKN